MLLFLVSRLEIPRSFRFAHKIEEKNIVESIKTMAPIVSRFGFYCTWVVWEENQLFSYRERTNKNKPIIEKRDLKISKNVNGFKHEMLNQHFSACKKSVELLQLHCFWGVLFYAQPCWGKQYFNDEKTGKSSSPNECSHRTMAYTLCATPGIFTSYCYHYVKRTCTVGDCRVGSKFVHVWIRWICHGQDQCY